MRRILSPLVLAGVLLAFGGATPARALASQRAQVVTATTPTAAAPAPTTSTPEGQAAAIAAPAIAYLEMNWHAWVMTDQFGEVGPIDWGTRCTGFFVSPTGYVATAGHCLDDGAEGAKDHAIQRAVVMLIDQGSISSADASAAYQYGKAYWQVSGETAGTPPDRTVYVQHGLAVAGKRSGEAWKARVIEVRDVNNGDVALAKVETADMPILTLAKDEAIDIGTAVLSIGYPGANDLVTDATYDPSFKDGKINQKTTAGSGAVPVYQTSAALSGGMSGGPTVDSNGDVVGVNSFTIRGESQAFDYIMPSSLVQELLSRNGVDNTLTATDVTYREAVAAYYSGDYRTAVTKLDAVLELVPSHAQAQSMRRLAAAKVAAMPATTVVTPTAVPSTAPAVVPAKTDSSSNSIALIAGVVVVLVLLAAGIAVWMLARRRRTPATVPVAGAIPAPSAPVGQMVTPHPEAMMAPPGAPPLVHQSSESIPDVVHFCSHCGTHVHADDQFCPECGLGLHAPAEHHSAT